MKNKSPTTPSAGGSCLAFLKCPVVNIALWILLGSTSPFILAAQGTQENQYPFSTDQTHLTTWNGTEYIPFFIKGMNLGVSVPGTFPGGIAASRDQYSRWLQEIKDAGFNCIRLYTLHFPRFYEALASYNLANPHNPLFIFQGVWLEEELPGYNNDLFFLTDDFRNEIQEDVDCVHGNRSIQDRLGKAYGTYSTDVSDWCMGYIIGREIHSAAINKTDSLHTEITNFQGNHFSIQNASASEVWCTEMLNSLVAYENQSYSTQRPVSFSSWPTLDPIEHPEETNPVENSKGIDLAKIRKVNAPAGMFISYHAYPYYPDFISKQTSYQSYSDNYGPNSYLGYLSELKAHYTGFPLIIAEYGVPSSWAIAHYASSGMNHGGFNEIEQGEIDIRLLHTIEYANCGGGIQFSWIDEWFKRTWVMDPVDYLIERRILWQNIASAEQNFGLVSFQKESQLQVIKQFDPAEPITYIKGDGNYTFFEMELGLNAPFDNPDELWIALDTYGDNLGESILPFGDTIPYRSEFALHITNHSAELFVTEAYDLYGIWHKISGPKQLYHSIPTDGAPWYIVRLKNNSYQNDVQYIGNLQVNQGFQPASSTDAVTLFNDKIRIRIPWSYINIVDPSQIRVLDDDRNTTQIEDTLSDGFNVSVRYKNRWFKTDSRYQYPTWNWIDNSMLVETLKPSYWVMQDLLKSFNSEAIAVKDSYSFIGPSYPAAVNFDNGLLANDFDLDGNYMVSLLAENPTNGEVELNNDGSFTYLPDFGYTGNDSFSYCIFDGSSLSRPNTVTLNITGNSSIEEVLLPDKDLAIAVYPNPCTDYFTVDSHFDFDEILLFNTAGIQIMRFPVSRFPQRISVCSLDPGTYYIIVKQENKIVSDKIIVSH